MHNRKISKSFEERQFLGILKTALVQLFRIPYMQNYHRENGRTGGQEASQLLLSLGKCIYNGPT